MTTETPKFNQPKGYAVLHITSILTPEEDGNHVELAPGQAVVIFAHGAPVYVTQPSLPYFKSIKETPTTAVVDQKTGALVIKKGETIFPVTVGPKKSRKNGRLAVETRLFEYSWGSTLSEARRQGYLGFGGRRNAHSN